MAGVGKIRDGLQDSHGGIPRSPGLCNTVIFDLFAVDSRISGSVHMLPMELYGAPRQTWAIKRGTYLCKASRSALIKKQILTYILLVAPAEGAFT